MTLIQPKIPFKRRPKESSNIAPKKARIVLDLNLNSVNCPEDHAQSYPNSPVLDSTVETQLIDEKKSLMDELDLNYGTSLSTESFDPYSIINLDDLDEKFNIPPEEENRSYVEQFTECILSVLESEAYLVDECTGSKFLNCSSTAKELYIRLFNRRWRWIRLSSLPTDKLCPELIAEGIEELCACGFVEIGWPIDSHSIYQISTKIELEQICREHSLKISGKSKNELWQSLLTLMSLDECISALKIQIGKLTLLNENVRQEFFRYFIVYQRLDKWIKDDKFMLTSILANLKHDNGNRRPFVNVQYVRSPLFWPTKDDLDDYIAALKLEAVCIELLDANTHASHVQIVDNCLIFKEKWLEACRKSESHVTGISWFGMFTAGWVWTRIMHIGQKALFALKKYSECANTLRALLDQRLFCSYKRGRWYVEYAKILERYIDVQMAKKLCSEGLSDIYVLAGERESLVKRLKRLTAKDMSLPCALWHIEEKKSISTLILKGV
jgi:hypothetical protein